MAYCPHCAYLMPRKGDKVTCPNCGRTKVKLANRKPTVYSQASAYELRESTKGTFFSSIAAAITIGICGLVFLALGLVIRSPISLFWILLGVLGGGVSIYCFREIRQNFFLGRNAERGYIDHLRDLTNSRESLKAKILELENLLTRQHPRQSDRAANRMKLLKAALENRKRKLRYVDEAEFVIESKKRISGIAALAQDLSTRHNLKQSEKDIEAAFLEMKRWVKKLPVSFVSEAGKNIRHSLTQAMELHSDIMEQIEDRMVMSALDDGAGSNDEFVLEHINRFLERTSLNSELDTYDIEEAVIADEEYIKINTELRLMKDGIKHDFTNDPFVDLDEDPKASDYPSGLS